MPHPYPESTRILVADDSALERSRLVSVVRALGFEAIEVADSSLVVEEALAKKPFLITLDVVMAPVSGFEVCRLLQKDDLLRHVPIVMCSVKATEVDHMWAKRLGVGGYLAKPFDPERARLFLANQIARARELNAARAARKPTASSEKENRG